MLHACSLGAAHCSLGTGHAQTHNTMNNRIPGGGYNGSGFLNSGPAAPERARVNFAATPSPRPDVHPSSQIFAYSEEIAQAGTTGYSPPESYSNGIGRAEYLADDDERKPLTASVNPANFYPPGRWELWKIKSAL